MVGLAPAARLADVSERLRKAQARVEAASQKLEEAQADAREWRRKYETVQKRLQQVDERAAERAARDGERLKSTQAAAEREADRRAEREKKRAIDVPALEARLDDAERTLTTAREHLMAVEVKLDILEGAATVLDVRTRKLLAHAGS